MDGHGGLPGAVPTGPDHIPVYQPGRTSPRQEFTAIGNAHHQIRPPHMQDRYYADDGRAKVKVLQSSLDPGQYGRYGDGSVTYRSYASSPGRASYATSPQTYNGPTVTYGCVLEPEIHVTRRLGGRRSRSARSPQVRVVAGSSQQPQEGNMRYLGSIYFDESGAVLKTEPKAYWLPE
mmetsp:Transcript_46263/g.82647  ORF Transcript_46263/g.82647 Transcript_46263/m.82647 type:complete len:177 (-) Transcript_46263:113-643(-)